VFLGTVVDVTVTGVTPPPTTTSPLVLRFLLDRSLIPPDQDATSITVSKDGAMVLNCTGPAESAVPDPCVSDRQVSGDGDVLLTIVTTTASEWAFSVTACGNAPRQGCQAAAGGKAKLKVKEAGAKDGLVWVWKSSADTALALFGHPDVDTSYSLCLYDFQGVRLQVDVPAGGTCGVGPCWTSTPKGFGYKSKDGTPDGATKLQTVAGPAGRAKILMKAKGPSLSVPSLPIASPVLVQASTSDGVCFEASYTSARRNDARLYTGLSD
jgi:hypothetical protein